MIKTRNSRLLKPWTMRGPGMTGRKTALFAIKILEKYGVLKKFLFDEAALVFLEQISQQDNKKRKLEDRIEFTVKLMLLHQKRNRLSKDRIARKNEMQSNIRHYINVNLNHILAADRRNYSEFHQISIDRRKMDEFNRRMERYEKNEKKLVYQMQNSQMIRPGILQKSFYTMIGQLIYKNQQQLNRQMFHELAEQRQLKHHLNRLLEINHLRKTFEKHDFLHVLQRGSLEEKRAAYQVLRNALEELNQENTAYSVGKGKKQKDTSSLLSAINRISYYSARYMQHSNKMKQHTHEIKHYYGDNITLVYQEEKIKLRESILQARENKNRYTEELNKLKQKLDLQKVLTFQEQEQLEIFQKQLEEQGKQVSRIAERQIELRKQVKAQKGHLPDAVAEQIKSQLHLERIRYGLE